MDGGVADRGLDPYTEIIDARILTATTLFDMILRGARRPSVTLKHSKPLEPGLKVIFLSAYLYTANAFKVYYFN